MVPLPARGMDVTAIAKVAFTSEDRVQDVIRNFNADGFSSLCPRHTGGRPPKFTLAQRREIKKIARSRPADWHSSVRCRAGMPGFRFHDLRHADQTLYQQVQQLARPPRI